MPGQNDTDLPVAAARRGDSAAWQRLFDRYQRPIFVFINELMRDREASLDLVQDTFLRAVRHLPSLRDERRFGSWLFGIAHQLCTARARRSWREAPLGDLLDATLDDSLARPGDELIHTEQAAELFALLAELPEGQRATPPFTCWRILYHQTQLNLAYTALLLERWRLRHGHYPATLTPLAQELGVTPPHDLIDGQPLRYRPLGDDGYLLYSIGENQVDDGGKASPPPTYDANDWVW